MTTSIFASSVCMPSCPTINASAVRATYNDAASIAALQNSINTMTDPTAKATAQAEVNQLEGRVSDLKSEVTYMEGQLGDTKAELDRSNIYCLCNRKLSPL